MEDGLSPKTIKNVNGVLHKALSQAARIGELKDNPGFILDVYGHASQKMRQKSVDRMEQYIMGVLNN